MNFDWDPEKNEKLKRERDISFEEIAFNLGEGNLWKIESQKKKLPASADIFHSHKRLRLLGSLRSRRSNHFSEDRISKSESDERV